MVAGAENPARMVVWTRKKGRLRGRTRTHAIMTEYTSRGRAMGDHADPPGHRRPAGAFGRFTTARWMAAAFRVGRIRVFAISD
jgi:hypothetical protein